MKKKMYEAPRVEVIEVENEGVMALSMAPDGGLTPDPASTRNSSSPYNASALSDFEDMINDILTF